MTKNFRQTYIDITAGKFSEPIVESILDMEDEFEDELEESPISKKFKKMMDEPDIERDEDGNEIKDENPSDQCKCYAADGERCEYCQSQVDEEDEVDMEEAAPAPEKRPLYTIAREIRRDWGNVNYAAKPYLEAMSSLDSIDDNYGYDSGRSVVAYFLSNASSWKGPKAKEIKLELKSLLKR